MAPLPKESIEHFTHPGHQLFEVFENKEYLCDACKTLGIGTRYRCNACDYDLHEHCGTCPITLSSFMHPQHQLNLVVRKPQAARQMERICDVCGDHVEGLFYRCKLCEFDVHPLCTQLPQHLRHVLHPHPDHPLTLQPAPSGWCMVCQSECTGWRYRCAVSNCFDIHVGCVLTECDTSTSTSRSVHQPSAPPATVTAPPSFGGFVYGVPCGYTYADPYNMYHQHQYGGNNHQQYQYGGNNHGPGGGKKRKKMYVVVKKLAVGVVTNIVFGAIGL